MHDPNPDRRVRSCGESICVGDRARPQLVQVEVRVTELQEPRAELVFVRVPILLDKAMGLQSLEKAVHCGPSKSEAVRKLADAQPARPACERFQDRGGAVERLD